MKPSSISRVLFTVCIAALVYPSAAQARTLPSVLQFQDLVDMVQLVKNSTAISPDGKYVAYATSAPTTNETTSFSNAVGHMTLWVVNLASGRKRTIGDLSADNCKPAWSPDSRRIAFFSGHGSLVRLALWNIGDNTSRTTPFFVVPPPYSTSVQWLPDNRRIIFAALPADSINALSSQRRPHAVPTPAVVVFSTTPLPAAITQNSHRITVPSSVTDGLPSTNLMLFDTRTGASTVLVSRFTRFPPGTPMQISPNGRSVLYLIDKGQVNGDNTSRELYELDVVDLRTYRSKVVARNVLSGTRGTSFSWSHDGSKIAFIGGLIPDDMDVTTDNYNVAFPGHCYIIDVTKSGAPRRLGEQLLKRDQAPLVWSADDKIIYAVDDENQEHASIFATSVDSGVSREIVSFDGRITSLPQLFSIFGRHHYVQAIANGGERRIYDVDPLRGTKNLVFHAYQNVADLTFAADGTRSAYVGEDPRHPPDVWIAESGFAVKYQLTHLNPTIDNRALGNAQSVSWTSSSGIHLDGTLLLPANYQPGKRYPTVTWIYGGEPEGTWGRAIFGIANAFGDDMSGEEPFFNLQLLASRGYAVFVPDTVLHVGTPMRDLADCVLPGEDKIVAMGIADPHHLGLYGMSYGGTSTLALLVQSDRFTAAVAMAGMYDLSESYAMLFDNGGDWGFWAESGQGRMGGSIWDQRQRYIDNSPFFFLDKVRTPLLIEYGTSDVGAGDNAAKVFVGLRRLGQTAELLRYEEEGHGIAKTSNQLDFTTRLLAWFHKYL